ncbi:hypothetical protein I7I50_08161 [Histoplasma capsulatum G186AR]|uniref:Secreted protein n=1 Tax=Ajellomyces capsulatus TaxID=5037 RepID=A0A8H7YFD8_AJECA|nr:hypothetical protein I7I52_08677 [Histoplasma capsulatum]QSS68673.1 hypothetical protein I7I50_08161 [Histoplasma capsulatum G186AR]
MQWVIVCIFGCVIRILSNLCLPPAVQHPAHGPVSLRVTLLAPPAGKRHDDGNLWIRHENQAPHLLTPYYSSHLLSPLVLKLSTPQVRAAVHKYNPSPSSLCS